MTEDQHRKWDIIIKGVITPLIAVMTVLVGVYQYTDGQKTSLEKEFDLKKEERKEIFEKEKTDLYKETRRIVSFLATNPEDSDLYKAKKARFWELYWGDLAAVESPEIEALMVRFGRQLNNLDQSTVSQQRKSTKTNMRQVSLEIARQTGSEINNE